MMLYVIDSLIDITSKEASENCNIINTSGTQEQAIEFKYMQSFKYAKYNHDSYSAIVLQAVGFATIFFWLSVHDARDFEFYYFVMFTCFKLIFDLIFIMIICIDISFVMFLISC